ncbi:hypothetical protein [uncultured Cocleimonas sp.]|uniref:hypothetical protein n=1 Tax=uncultured Cocleimonas sp. TaxID=1051587 RepID=UPI00262A0AB3|nr:hypothetical protein [uncultured Cocleimonas sp.]
MQPVSIGHVILKLLDEEISIQQGQLVYLDAGVKHALSGVQKSVVLLTIVL